MAVAHNTLGGKLVLLEKRVRKAVEDVYGTDRDLDQVIKEASLRLHVGAVGGGIDIDRDARSPATTMRPPDVSPPLQHPRIREARATQTGPPARKRLFEAAKSQASVTNTLQA